MLYPAMMDITQSERGQEWRLIYTQLVIRFTRRMPQITPPMPDCLGKTTLSVVLDIPLHRRYVVEKTTTSPSLSYRLE